MKYILPLALILLVLGLIASLSFFSQQAWLAPSLGSAAFSQLLHPDEKASRPASIALGQIIGAVGGVIGVLVTHQVHAHPFVGDHDLLGGRVVAVAVALILTAAAQLASGYKTPAGGATALVVSIGIETVSAMGIARLLCGIVLVTILGEAARQVILRTRGDKSDAEQMVP